MLDLIEADEPPGGKMGATILPNVQIGDNCVVAAGSVVNRSFGNNCVIMGNPAKTVLSFDMYQAMRRASPCTITSEEYPFPKPMPAAARRHLIETRMRDLPVAAPHASQTESQGAQDTIPR